MQPYIPRSVLDEIARRRMFTARKATTWPAIVHLAAAARRSLGMMLIRAGRRLGGRLTESTPGRPGAVHTI